ncbi:TPA: restriction endonuclease subunit S [Klebsiella pneumoniae]|mgnify:FL=1|nr:MULTISPECIES: restriction endonuclease subunit S [Enterobacteriaceae]EDD6049304.1 restriction endonuclease subunit S [Salmonella enterica subsp. enterica serovar Senftenberg]EGA5556234.1 restriction endonuclease subunit S [Salmonella enterica]ELT1858886.1 restriction endonuclease subunit S [Escherichia coli]POV58420.1 restriction endonuclease subunit S [Citrobacter freundii complex sp. CFNIH11]HBS4244277.1 restriction endonuclease subunit S [Klebsiella quasipneumoniae subsp. quasipneumoniae
MSSNWSVKKLGDLVTFLSGGTPSKSNKDYWNGEIPWISASSMQSTRYHDSDLRVTSLGSTNGTRLVPAETVLLLVRGGALHNKIPVGITTREVTFNQDVKALVPKSEDITPYYLLAWLISSRELLLGKVENTGIGAGKLDTKILQDLDVPVPPKAELLRLELFSKALDDKIILNQNINHTLEQMAQALFKSWFVDFEPVKAKMAVLEAGGSQEDATLAAMAAISGKDAYALAVFEREHPEQYAELKTTAELFPSAMQDSELGEIPEGWSIKPLDGIATYQNGLALQKFRPENENDFLPVVKIAQLKKGFSDGEEKASPNIKPECIIDNGDVVFSWSGSLMVDIWCGGKAALNQHLFKVSSTKYPKWLYYKYTAHHLIEFQRIAEAKAVTMGHIKREHLSQAKCLMPSSETVHAFTPFFEPVLNKVISNRLETRKLENIRDTLLPKLLSGEITLPEAEQAVSEVENV